MAASVSADSMKAIPGGTNEANRLTAATLPRGVVDLEYAVRGEIVLLAGKIQAEIKEKGPGNHGYPFEKLVMCNIGNPQAVGQKPLTFHRQVMSIMSNVLAGNTKLDKSLPEDVVKRGLEYQATAPGAYSHSKGTLIYRRQVADNIERRDKAVNVPVDVEDIFLTDGASVAVKTVIEMMIHDANDVVLIPIPQYPLYSATVTRLGGTCVGYEMKEDYSEGEKATWSMDLQVMEKKIQDAMAKKQRVKGIAVINPGNPTGNVLSREDIEGVVSLAEKYDIAILADEVYQENVYAKGKQFFSFREVVLARNSKAMVFSFHSISKGYYGECGIRGGYLHCTNVDTEIIEQMYKLMSLGLCSNTLGQAMMASISNPPMAGTESYSLFAQEKAAIMDALQKKSELVYRKLNEIPNVNCMPIEGAMYAFPQVVLPAKYVEHAKSLGKAPDTLYCIEVLKKLGVVVVPGNGFGQKEGTYHYRMTILPEEKELERVLDGLKDFQAELEKTWATKESAPKKEGKKEGKNKGGEEKPAAAAEDPEKARKDKLKKVIKEGGKRGVEIEGAADMGGLQFFCTSMDLPEGDIELLTESLKAMNAESDPTEEERKGGSGRIGKMIFSAGAEQLAVVAYVPEAKQSELSCEEWIKDVLGQFGGEVASTGKEQCTGFVKTDSDNNVFPLKIREPMIITANNFLRKKGLFPEDDDDDDEMVFGDDDFPS